jgi:hypothetical protein
MTQRSHSKSVVFSHSFELKGVDRILPPGEYRIVTDEELIEELSFPVYRRVATMIFVPAVSHHASSIEMVAIDPQELQAAFKAAFMMQRGVPCAFGVTTARWRHRFCLGASFQFSGPFLVAAMNSPQPRATSTNAIIIRLMCADRSHDVLSERTASWVKIGKIQTETLQKSVITLRAPDVMHPHSAFGRYRESCPRRSELCQNCYSRDGDERSAVLAGG